MVDMRGFEEREVSWFAKWIIGEVGVVDERSGSERVGEMGERGCRWNLMIGDVGAADDHSRRNGR